MPKNIMVCFDGTNNHPKSAEQEREWFGLGNIEDQGITNILKLHVLFGGDLRNEAKTPTQHSFYYSGVGTYGIKLQQIFNAGFAPANLDVGRIIRTAGKDIASIYHPGDRIFVFGFSRGAAIARRFSAVLGNYITIAQGEKPIRFVGVFDTVASIGMPNLHRHDQPVSDVVFENQTISLHIQEALHLVSIDENRVAFQPTLMNAEPRVTEIWFPGAHSDVGGGFWYDGLSDVTLEFMRLYMQRKKLGVEMADPAKIDYSRLAAADGGYRIDFEDVFIKPNILAKHHMKDRWGPVGLMTLCPRAIYVCVNDRPAPGLYPTVYSEIKTRIDKIIEYRPRALKGVRHCQMDIDGNLMTNIAGEVKLLDGIRDYIA